MPKVDSTLFTLGIAGIIVLATAAVVRPGPVSGQRGALTATATAHADATPARAQWAASATGRVEPKDGEVRLSAQAAGRIVDVSVKTGDRVKKGDVIVRLDDEDLWIRHSAAESEAQVRLRERDEDPDAKGTTPRRRADDAVYDAERAVFRARMAVDAALAAQRNGTGTLQALDDARAAVKPAEDKLQAERGAFARLADTSKDSGKGLPTRLEGSLYAARAEVALAEQAIERTRVRAPADGTVLTVPARAGEFATPSPEAPLAVFGDLTALRVRAEVEERDAMKVRVGQRVVVRADAFPDRDFEGKVTSIASALAAPRINTRGPRRPNDVEVLEVQASIDGDPPLLTGMRVDVFFRSETAVSAAPAKPAVEAPRP